MENEFLNKVEDNAAVRAWSEKLQSEKGDSLTEGYVSELQEFTRVNAAQNELQELRDIWARWDEEAKQSFYQSYGNISYLLDIKVDKHLFRAMVQFWNAAYKCFTFGEVDLVPTLEEYTAPLQCPKVQVKKAYAKVLNGQTFTKKLMNISGMSEPWVAARIQQKGDNKCIPWENLRDLVLAHPDERKRIDIFALSIYGLVIFPKALRHVDEAVTDLFDRLEKGIMPVPAILAETFRSLNMCRKSGNGRFIGCAQLLMVWFHGHFWKVDKVSYRVFYETYSPLKEEAAIQRREDISEEKWMEILQNLKEEDIEWRAFWMVPDEILYRCGNFDWVPLLGIWGATGYTPLLALRQYKSRQFIPATYGLAQCEFSFKDAHYKKKVRELSDAWKQTRWMKRLAVGSIVTPEYDGWFKKRVNDNVPRPSLENTQPMVEHLRVVPSELEIIKQDFERKSLELGKKIEQLEEEKMHLRLDADIQRSEAEKWKKGKTKAEEDLDSLKTDYKKLRLSIRTAGLGKTSEQWRHEIREKKTKADRWERKFREAQARNEELEKSLSESRNEQGELRARVAELEKSLHQYRNRNTMMELRASLSKIEEMKERIEELEAALQNCEMRIQFFEAGEERWKEQLHHAQDQVRNRDYIMGEAITQIREVADYLQTLAVQVDILSVKYELESDRGQELASLFMKIKALSVRAKSYFNLETDENLSSTHPYGTRTKAMDKKLERLEQMQKEMQEQMQAQVQEQLAKIQQEMRDQMLESQRNMMEELTRLLTNRPDKGKGPMVDTGNNNEDPLYPPGFAPANAQTQHETHTQRPSITEDPPYPPGFTPMNAQT
ncbi:hypothetical protein CXB51_007511 [Gossypium anomalum]|uniref:DUF7745 domain-containing protein n=1 Tax=Gossypium anomalum TaxID=47600 RepID=A0A8J5Z776_9ROSI|nr:hypothetical protein CXB51_007511 [Gossypium anomalum]